MSWGEGLFAISAMSSVGQMIGGFAKGSEADANAKLIESKNKITAMRQEIEEGRYVAKGSKMARQAQAAIGAAGLKFAGSSVAYLVEQERQLNIDKAISKFDYEMEKSYTTAEAEAERRRGRYERTAGVGNAFSTMLKAGYAYAAYNDLLGTNMFKKKES